MSEDKPKPMRPINNEIKAFVESMQEDLWLKLGEKVDPDLRDRLYLEFNDAMQTLRNDANAIDESVREAMKNVKPKDIEGVAKQLS